MYRVKQSPQFWQSHSASVMKTLGFRRCKSDSNLYCHPSKELYILAYVDDLLLIGDAQKTKDFVDPLSKELLVKITGKLEPGTEHSFVGRKLRRNLVFTFACDLSTGDGRQAATLGFGRFSTPYTPAVRAVGMLDAFLCLRCRATAASGSCYCCVEYKPLELRPQGCRTFLCFTDSPFEPGAEYVASIKEV